MLASIIKFFFVYYFTFYVCNKIMRLSIQPFLQLVHCILALAASFLTYFLGIYFVEIKYIVPLLLIWLCISVYSTKPQVSFVSCSISYGISYSLYAIISFIICFIVFLIYGSAPIVPYFLIATFSSLMHTIAIILLLRINRFKNGMSFLLSTPAINIATILCLFFVSLLIYVCMNEQFRLGFLSCTFLLAFLIYWWQAQITKAYRRNLELRELESLRTELQEKNATMMRVMQENERIRRINHRDNGLITALDYAVNDYLVSDFADAATAKARREELLLEIERVRAGRTSSVNVDEVKSERYETSISLLNILLNHTSKRAIDEHVLFSVHIATELDTYIPRIISEDDFVHLLSDLLENAFVATKNVTSPMIQLQFYKWNKSLVIEVADNGIPFEIDSILNMGICELTTHADTGGSGIGLMDIWNTKEQYGATYHLEEYENPAPFSKKISLTFDKKNRYSVRTWRKDEILQKSKRVDLQVYDFSEQ